MAKANKHSKLSEWQKTAQLGGECARCKKKSEKLSVDHIIPEWVVSSLDPTGQMRYEDEENFELVCYVCNHWKAGRIDKNHPKTKNLLLKYINL